MAHQSRSSNEYHREYYAAHADERRQYYREYYAKNKATRLASNRKYEQANREKKSAHRRVKHALLVGKLERLPCEVCGDIGSEAHHDDYSRPLDVRWLCPRHHGEHHRDI